MNTTRRFSVAVACAVLLASCATTPKTSTATTASAPTTTKAATTSAPPPAPLPAAAPKSTTTIPNALSAEIAKAKQMKAEIAQNLPNGQTPAAYTEGSAALAAAENAVGTDNTTAKTQADIATADFQRVIAQGQALYQARMKQDARAKATAAAARADRAVPDQWNEAVSLEQQAAAQESADRYLSAYDLLGQAIDAYDGAATTAKELRAAAQQAIAGADNQIGESKSQIAMIQQSLNADEARTKAAAQGGQ